MPYNALGVSGRVINMDKGLADTDTAEATD